MRNTLKIVYTFAITFLLIFATSCNNSTKKKDKTALKVADNLSKTHTTKNSKKPNIIAIIIDDAGYADFGFMGSKDLETPHIDALAKSGVIFTDAHVSATVCAPSRAGLITGRYQQKMGFEANHTGDQNSGDLGLSDDATTIASVFKANDYQTVAIGKWHLGATETDHPNNRGFIDFYGFLAGGRSYFPLKNPTKELMLQHNNKRVIFDGYLTDVLGDYSVKYIEKHKDKPFFMYLSYNAVHTPMHAKKVHLNKYKNHPRKELAAMTWSLDENVGKLIEKLKELQIYDNTLIYFLSDNGGANNNDSSNGVLKGWKGNKFEGGHRVPFVMSWPAQLKENQTFNGMSSSLDIFTTSLAAANIETADKLALDGVDLMPYLKGIKNGNPHTELYWRKLEETAMRYNNFKLIQLEGYGKVLYDLSTDLSETKDLSKNESQKTELLSNKLSNWESQLLPPFWKEDQDWMDVTYHIHKRLMQNKKALYSQPNKNLKISR